jgi:hypothetical protein
MGAALVQRATAIYENDTSKTATFSSDVTTGNAIIVFVFMTDGAAPIGTPTDSGSNTYSAAGAMADYSERISRVFYALNVTGGSSFAVTVANTGAGYGGIIAEEVSGLTLTDALDKYAQNYQENVATDANAITSGSVTTTTNGQYVFGATHQGNNLAHQPGIGTGFTGYYLYDSGVDATVEYLVQSSAGSVAATFTSGDATRDWITHIATFKAASAAQFARPASTVAAGNWDGFISGVDQNDSSNLDNYIDEETASDTDSIRSATSPSDDTCTVTLSSISTPDVGTVTMRVRCRTL